VAEGLHRVTMYSRTTCGLCDKAREVILAVLGRTPFAYEEIFVDGDDDLEREYGLRVPVVLVDGREEFEIEVQPQQLEAALARDLEN
jgi:glutaredoxin